MTVFILAIMAMIQVAGGVLVYMLAKSAIHEILAAISFGLGMIQYALAVLVHQLNEILKTKTTPAAPPPKTITESQGSLHSTYRGHQIFNGHPGFRTLKSDFATLDAAKAAIDHRESGNA